jgi:hypothetical protein
MKGSSLASRSDSLVCPLCEAGQLRPFDGHSVRCNSCGSSVGGGMLEALRQITDLPDAMGTHVCECGHPEMRLLPDRTFHCPACGAEVLPLETSSAASEVEYRSEAYWAGWWDARSGKWEVFTGNRELPKWEAPSDRLDYYRGHRAGSEVR